MSVTGSKEETAEVTVSDNVSQVIHVENEEHPKEVDSSVTDIDSELLSEENVCVNTEYVEYSPDESLAQVGDQVESILGRDDYP